MPASLKQLRYFDAVVRHGHFGRAAERCAVTQPALSMQIQELERQLGVVLLERRPRGVAPTRAGQEIHARARRILDELQALEDIAHGFGAPLAGALHVGIIPTIAPYLLPRLLRRARESFPDLTLHVRETQTHGLLRELEEGVLDLLVIALPVDQSGVATLPLFEDPFLLALPAEADPTATGFGPVLATQELLRNSRLLLLEEGHCFRDQALSLCHRPGGETVDTLGASSLSTIVQMVASGMGVTLLPEMSVAVEAREGDLRLLRFAEPEPTRVVGLAWRDSSPRREEFALFGELVAEVMGKPAAACDAASGQ